MLRKVMLNSLAVSLVLMAGAIGVPAQSIAPAEDYDDYDRAKIDRYLDVEVWSDHSDGEYYEGDNIVINFRANRDAFVALYSIDTRGRVNLLFPTYPDEDNFIHGGVTYSLPGGGDDYDLEVSGPEGFENIQIIASRERFPIPDWYRGPELVADWEDRDDYMDWLNANYFVRYGGQRFAYDRAVIYVNEWEEYYFRPVYRPIYPSWTVYGNFYVDYAWGSSVYVNGIYWGVAPLYVPRVAVGWHTITLYDHYGHCWEHDFHVSRYNTVVFNKTIINTSPTIKSKYKEVRTVGYRNPVQYGYPRFEERKATMLEAYASSRPKVSKSTRGKTAVVNKTTIESLPKKYVRGSTKIVKTSRGYETDASNAVFPKKKVTKQGSTDRNYKSMNSTGSTKPKGSSGTKSRSIDKSDSGRKQNRSSATTTYRSSDSKAKSGSSGSIQRKSGSSVSKRKTSGSTKIQKKSSSSSKSTQSAPKVEKRKSSGKSSSGSVKQTPSKSKPAKKSSDSRVKKQETKAKSSPAPKKGSSKGGSKPKKSKR